MNEEKIKNIIDKYLNQMIDAGINIFPGDTDIEMLAINDDKNKEWKTWIPIDSTVTDSEIEKFEIVIKHKLPDDYKTFLKYKHFYELYIYQASFLRLPVSKWDSKLLETIFNGYPKEYLIEKAMSLLQIGVIGGICVLIQTEAQKIIIIR
jgi:hypothetical protein